MNDQVATESQFALHLASATVLAWGQSGPARLLMIDGEGIAPPRPLRRSARCDLLKWSLESIIRSSPRRRASPWIAEGLWSLKK